MRGCQKEQGSALLIVMVVVSVVATLSLTIIQLTLMSSRSVLLTEDGINAQIVAMAGIEDGLLRWKFNRNAEAPQKNPQNDCTDYPHDGSDKFDRIILGADSDEGSNSKQCISQDRNPPSSSQMAYDIKMYHRLPPGTVECVGTVPSHIFGEDVACMNLDVALERDRTAEYTLEGLTSSNLMLYWKLDPILSPENIVLEVISLRDERGDTVVSSKANYALSNNPSNNLTCDASRECRASFNIDNGDILRIKPFGADLIYYAIEAGAAGDSLDTRFTTMDVTGYYGGVQRRLTLKLDRLTGQALPIYDFALFASGPGGISGGPED